MLEFTTSGLLVLSRWSAVPGAIWYEVYLRPRGRFFAAGHRSHKNSHNAPMNRYSTIPWERRPRRDLVRGILLPRGRFFAAGRRSHKNSHSRNFYNDWVGLRHDDS
jgi:hypothetical protein